jgi:8-oxo-dGTP pyrophosphatase MutT (NUDIX family)
VSTFLLDANLSPRTSAFLSDTFGLDVVHQGDVLPGSPTEVGRVREAARREVQEETGLEVELAYLSG